MANTKRFSPRQLSQLAESRRIIAEAKTVSVQPRFDPKNTQDFFNSTIRWAKDAFETIPEYSSDSRKRSLWLTRFWPNEPYLAGVINSAVQIERNRGWSMVGGRNQILRFTDKVHNWQVQPGRASYREGAGAEALAFFTTDIGGLGEVAREFEGGPFAGLYHLDPTRCTLRANVETPLRYHPRTGKVVDFAPSDYIRMTSLINVEEDFNGLGYCALSRAVELAILMVAVYRHEQEQLFARAPRGLLLLKGINEQTWKNAMLVRDATLDSKQQKWFGATAVLASAGQDDVDAKLIALSQLPANFDQKIFTDLLMYGYALCFGYDPREFWPVSSGTLGSATETETQKRKATAKGEKEFCLALQEELQNNLPDTIHFEIDERSVDGELAEAQLQLVQMRVINAMLGVPTPQTISTDQALTLAAEAGIIPDEWAVGGADTTATDVEDADSPGSENDNVPGTTDVAAQMLQLPEVQRAVHDFPDEPLCIYRWNGSVGRITELPIHNKHKTVHPIAVIMQRLAKEIENAE